MKRADVPEETAPVREVVDKDKNAQINAENRDARLTMEENEQNDANAE